jgi:hypothetical protein
VTERVRVLARSKTHLEVYQLKGSDQVKDIEETLNAMFQDKGLNFDRIIIKNVILPKDIAEPLDVKAQYNSLNEYEREKHKFELQKINDDEALQLIRQKKQEERDTVKENFLKEQALVEREILIIEAETKKKIEEIEQQQNAEVLKINAESTLFAEEVMAETKIIEKKLLATGRAEADLVKAENEAWCLKKRAEVENQISSMKAEQIQEEAKVEAEIAKVLSSRRKYEYLTEKLKVIQNLGNNPNVKIFGNQNDNVVSQMAAYRLMHPEGQR